MREPQFVGQTTGRYSRFFCVRAKANIGQANSKHKFMIAGHLYINTRDELIRLDCSKIVYMEGDGNYTNIVLINKQKVSVCMNLSHMQQFISESLRERASIFARVGKRFIVNLNYVYKIQPLLQSLVVTDGVNFAFQLGISKEALRKLKDILVERIPNKTYINNVE